MSGKPTLYIIDGYAQFFRAYHAIRSPMTSPVTKEPTNLTFGFVGMLLKLLRGEGKVGGHPAYVAVALDVSGDRGTFRSEISPDYKATRPPPPEDLPVQVERCLSMMGDMGIPLIGVEGYEADDVIATMTESLAVEHPDLCIRIISKDKDLKQLLDAGRVEMYDIHTDQVIDVESLKNDTGLDPGHIVDMLALMGDTADNVPGVPGVGPKTASQLIVQYGSLENLLAHADEIKGKRGERIRESVSLLATSKRLVTLVRDVPMSFSLADAKTEAFNLDALMPVLKTLGFNRFQNELNQLTGNSGNVVETVASTPTQHRVPCDGGGLFDHLDDDSLQPSRAADDSSYECIGTTDELKEHLSRWKKSPALAVDCETTGLSPLSCQLVGFSVTDTCGTGAYIPVRSPEPDSHLTESQVVELMRPVLEDPAVPKVGQNLKFDMLVMRKAGIELRGLVENGFDSMVASYLIDSSRSSHSLDALAMAYLDRTNISIRELIGTGKKQKSFDQVPLSQATPYAAEDVDVALMLREKMLPQLEAMDLLELFSTLEMPLVGVLAELEWNGILVDPDELEQQRQRLAGRIEELKQKIEDSSFEAVGRVINPDSPKQLSSLLFGKTDDPAEPGLGIKPIKRTKTGYSTDVEVLEKLQQDPSIESPLPELVLEYRQLTKLVGTYLVNLAEQINPRTGRIHASFNQTVAATGRLSSSDPNLQNIPIRTDTGREIRRAFIAPPGHVLISADYSQIELRLLAHLSGDPALIEAFHAGADIHTSVAAQIHAVPVDQVTREQRNGAKMVNFGIIYGITPYGLARRLGIGNSEAEEIITDYKKRFTGISTFLEECIAQARTHGFVETMLRRRRPITDIDSRNRNRKSLAERMAINSVVQGSAADLIKLAMIDLHNRLSPNAPARRDGPPEIEGVRMLLQIHDELVFEAPTEVASQARELIVHRMEQAMSLTVPLRVEASESSNWFDGK